jgi:hypothetical protein
LSLKSRLERTEEAMNKAFSWSAGAAMFLAISPAAARQPGIGLGFAPARGHAGGAVRVVVGNGSPSFSQPPGHGGCGRPGRWGCGYGYAYGYGWIGYGGGLIEDPEALRDQGYFADGASGMENGRAVYDYDRSYPYDWYRDPDAARRPASRLAYDRPMVRCDVTWVAGARGTATPVRVCRGRR